MIALSFTHGLALRHFVEFAYSARVGSDPCGLGRPTCVEYDVSITNRAFSLEINKLRLQHNVDQQAVTCLCSDERRLHCAPGASVSLELPAPLGVTFWKGWNAVVSVQVCLGHEDPRHIAVLTHTTASVSDTTGRQILGDIEDRNILGVALK